MLGAAFDPEVSQASEAALRCKAYGRGSNRDEGTGFAFKMPEDFVVDRISTFTDPCPLAAALVSSQKESRRCTHTGNCRFSIRGFKSEALNTISGIWVHGLS